MSLRARIHDGADVSSKDLTADVPNLKFINFTNDVLEIYKMGVPLIRLLPQTTQYCIKPFYIGDVLCIYKTGKHETSVTVGSTWDRVVEIDSIAVKPGR
jgi:hypothetical protein